MKCYLAAACCIIGAGFLAHETDRYSWAVIGQWEVGIFLLFVGLKIFVIDLCVNGDSEV
jgi:hypothetical protein